MIEQFEIETIIKRNQEYSQEFRSKVFSCSKELRYKFVSISDTILGMTNSIVAPAHHYNNFYNFIKNDEIGYKRLIRLQIEAQAILISIKIGLDRTVNLFRFYFKGISNGTTFGRIKENGSGKGFMNKVLENVEIDKLMKTTMDEYHLWIKEAVKPRDSIMHYSDLDTEVLFTTDSDLKKTLDFHTIPFYKVNKDDNSEKLSYEEFYMYVKSWLKFYDMIICEFRQRNPIV